MVLFRLFESTLPLFQRSDCIPHTTKKIRSLRAIDVLDFKLQGLGVYLKNNVTLLEPPYRLAILVAQMGRGAA